MAPPLSVRLKDTRAATGSRCLVPHRIAACGRLPSLAPSGFARDSRALWEVGPGDGRTSPCSGPAPARGGYVYAGQFPLGHPHPCPSHSNKDKLTAEFPVSQKPG